MNIAMVVMSEQAAVSASVGSVFRDANDAADRRGLPFHRRAPCRITHGSELSAGRSRDGATLLLNGASALQPVCTPLASELGPDGSNRPGPFREPASRASQPVLGETDDLIAAHLLPCVRVRGGRFLPSAALPDRSAKASVVRRRRDRAGNQGPNHELEVIRAMGGDARRIEVAEIEACLEKERALLAGEG